MAYHYRKKEQERRQRERERKVRRIKLIFGIDAALVLVLLLILAVSKGMSAGSGKKRQVQRPGLPARRQVRIRTWSKIKQRTKQRRKIVPGMQIRLRTQAAGRRQMNL